MITSSIDPYKYYSFELVEFKIILQKIIQRNKNITYIPELINGITTIDKLTQINTNNKIINAKIIFDSRINLNKIEAEAGNRTFLKLYFHGYKIKTNTHFNITDHPRLFDLHEPTKEDFTFGYILPIKPDEYMIELVEITKRKHSQANSKLKKYIDSLGIHKYSILMEEQGIILMSSYKYQRKVNDDFYRIGRNGGSIKPTTGYGFTRILEESKFVASQFIKLIPANIEFKDNNGFYRFTDSWLLNIMQKHPERLNNIFMKMFSQKNSSHVLTFLDENASLQQILKLSSTLPVFDFINL